jgi:uncharacterized protein
VFSDKSALERSPSETHFTFPTNRQTDAGYVGLGPASVTLFEKPDLTEPRAARSRLANHDAGAGLLTLLLVSGIGILCYSGVCRAFSLEISVWVMLAIFAAATVSGIAGFAFSAICGAMLFHVVANPIGTVEIMIICSIAIQILSVAKLKHAIDPRHLGRFLAGGIVGLPFGIYLLTHIASSIYMKCIGSFLICYGAYMLAKKPVPTGYREWAGGDYVAGFLGGITGGFAAFPGAFVTIWCGFKGLSKDQQRGIYQPFILVMQILALAVLFFVQSTEHASGRINPLMVTYIPAALLGTWCGIAIFRRLTEVQFAWSVNLLLVVSGLGLVA